MATVGEQLRHAREQMHLSIGDVADKTKIRKDHVEALERGDYDVFAAPVYVRGFVRSYATIVKIEPAPLLAELERELSESEKFHDHPFVTPPARGPMDQLMYQLSKVNWKVALPLLLLALLLLAGFWGYSAWVERRTKDPLKNLGPGLYKSPGGTGETLPIPPAPPSTNR